MKYNFWSLIAEYSIRIPVIQRDYAQGRLHPKVNIIRRSFIENILQHLNMQSQLELDFIYGAQQEGHLVILDGQQRLTTLFLLHFYLYSLQMSVDHEQRAYFKKFNYETRQSTGGFLESLIEHHHICLPDQKQQKTISMRIKNEGWYFSVWDYDPSIQGMLNMLDEIEAQISKNHVQAEQLWQRLTQELCISFHFLEMKDFNLSDELYIKMNARGVHLSEFENFKAWLNQKIPSEFAANFFHCLDQQWTDLFWSLKPKHQENIDDILYESFKVTCSGLLALMLSQQADKKNWDTNPHALLIDDLRKIINHDLQQKAYIDVKRYDELFDLKHCQQFYGFMNFIYVLKHDYVQIFNHIQPYLFEDKKIVLQQSYQAYILLFNVFIYCQQKAYLDIKSIQEDLAKHHQQFLDYFNISRRIVMNHVHNNLNDYVESIAALSQWAQAIDLNNVIQSVAVFNDFNIKMSQDFAQQIREEKYKAELIIKGWNQQQLERIADQKVFHGQIQFLLDWSLDPDTTAHEQKFIQYANKLINLFECSLAKEDANDHYLLQRLLLCYGDYLPKRSSKYTFCQMNLNGDARSHNENWRLVFNQETIYIDGQVSTLPFLQQLLNDLPVEFSRQDIIEKIDTKKQIIHDWRRLCIDYPQTITYTKNKLLDKTATDIHLIHQEKRTRFVELRSYCLGIKLRSVFKEQYAIDYKDSLFVEFPNSVEIKNDQLHLYIRYDSTTDRFKTFAYSSAGDERIIIEKALDKDAEILGVINAFTAIYLSKDACSEKIHE